MRRWRRRYSLLSTDYRTLGLVISVMEPGLVFADNGPDFAPAIGSVRPGSDVEIVTCSPADSLPSTSFRELASTDATAAVDDAHRRVGPDSVAKVLFTSGSTGFPKGVINTQRMLCANQEQIRTVMAFLADEPPVLCDWLPWNHTFGGNHNFGLTLFNGGTLYIDAGTPTPGAFATTVSNLREIAPTAYFNVPRAFELLLPVLESDRELRGVFFSRLQMLFYAAAGLRQGIVDAFERVAVEACGERIPWVTGLGATETAPFAICTGHMPEPAAGRIGVPVPGVELKMEPVGALIEARVRGPNVTPGYWRDPVLTQAAFDEDGFYAMGDAIEPVDPTDLTRGFVFRGRIAEDFKLATGTWVRVGPLRAALLSHFGDLVHDVAIAGSDRADIRLLVFPNLATCRRLLGAPPDEPGRACLEHPTILERFSTALASFAASRTGSSTRVEHALLLEQPPSLDAAEMTDKGSINQKAVLQHRRTLVDQLYGGPVPACWSTSHAGAPTDERHSRGACGQASAPDAGDEIVLHRVQDDLGGALQAHFLEDPRPVGADRLRAHAELLGDLVGGLACAQADEDFKFPIGQGLVCRERRAAREVESQLFGERARHVFPAGVNLANRVGQRAGRMRLREIAVGARLDDALRVVPLGVHAEDQDARRAAHCLETMNRVDDAGPRHRHVEQEHVDVARRAGLEHAVGILGFAHDLDVAVVRDDVLEPLADHRVIVRHHEADQAPSISVGVATGTCSRTAVPQPPARPM